MFSNSLTLVYYRGKLQIAQFCDVDPSPHGQGVHACCFLTDPEKIPQLKAVIDADLLYEPTPEQVERWEDDARSVALHRAVDHVAYWQKAVPSYSFADISPLDKEIAFRRALKEICGPTIPKDTGGEILLFVSQATKRTPIVKTKSFENISWTYVVDLDEDVLEVFGHKDRGCMGGECNVIENHRFDEVDWAASSGSPGNCLGRWKFEDIPWCKDFLRSLRDCPYD